ncbi:helix-turn-helix domain-containing protein [Rhodococcus sp. KRD162]|uniref:helix-turn-helix domain-containing protein n=2 Tax=Rhodococcus sp. KRD162 TaxID=2729725 RepID=UPI0035B45974
MSMVLVGQLAAAAHGDQSRVSDLGKDHRTRPARYQVTPRGVIRSCNHEKDPGHMSWVFLLVALEQLNLSEYSDLAHRSTVNARPDASTFIDTDDQRPRTRTRMTERLKDRVVELYETGSTSRMVAEELGIGKATVLKVLREREATVRPWGGRY